MNKVVSILGILMSLLALEGVYRIQAVVQAFGGGDAPFYMFAMLALVYAIVVFALSLAGKISKKLKIAGIIVLALSCAILLAGANVGAVQQGLVGCLVALVCMFLAGRKSKS